MTAKTAFASLTLGLTLASQAFASNGSVVCNSLYNGKTQGPAIQAGLSSDSSTTVATAQDKRVRIEISSVENDLSTLKIKTRQGTETTASGLLSLNTSLRASIQIPGALRLEVSCEIVN
jgi:hypothetical protein